MGNEIENQEWVGILVEFNVNDYTFLRQLKSKDCISQIQKYKDKYLILGEYEDLELVNKDEMKSLSRLQINNEIY